MFQFSMKTLGNLDRFDVRSSHYADHSSQFFGHLATKKATEKVACNRSGRLAFRLHRSGQIGPEKQGDRRVTGVLRVDASFGEYGNDVARLYA